MEKVTFANRIKSLTKLVYVHTAMRRYAKSIHIGDFQWRECMQYRWKYHTVGRAIKYLFWIIQILAFLFKTGSYSEIIDCPIDDLTFSRTFTYN
jgi:hypothetical protein